MPAIAVLAGLFSFALCAGFSPRTATAAVSEMPERKDPLMHNIRFVLVDQEEKIVGAYDSSDPASVQALILEANEILR